MLIQSFVAKSILITILHYIDKLKLKHVKNNYIKLMFNI